MVVVRVTISLVKLTTRCVWFI